MVYTFVVGVLFMLDNEAIITNNITVKDKVMKQPRCVRERDLQVHIATVCNYVANLQSFGGHVQCFSSYVSPATTTTLRRHGAGISRSPPPRNVHCHLSVYHSMNVPYQVGLLV